MSVQSTTPSDRLESFISLGAPTCDLCRECDPEERPDDGEYWPDPAIHYINHDAQRAVEWWGRTVCEHHDEFYNVPEEATHRVVDEPEYVGDDPERGNSSYTHTVTDVIRL